MRFHTIQADIFSGSAAPEDGPLLQNAQRIRDMGRLLMATEIRSMQTYWHVQAPHTDDISRVYPGTYSISFGTVVHIIFELCCSFKGHL